MKISIKKCKQRLAVLWLSCSIFLLIILIIQTSCGHYKDNESDNAREVFGWFFPLVMPTLSLIISVMVLEKSVKGTRAKTVNPFLFRISLVLSAFYLILVGFPILLHPFFASPPLKLMQQSNLWLGPIQGLVAASLGVFFVKKEQE
ncbi:MAG: hypothetical protein ACFFDN_17880 [Candidatus Hodarchaeota archaeon]